MLDGDGVTSAASAPLAVKLARSSSFREEQTITFTDADGRRLCFELARGGSFNFYVEGRQKVTKANKLHAEGLTLKVDGKRILSSACTAHVPVGEEHFVEDVLELFGQRRIEGRSPQAGGPLKVTIVSARGLRRADDFSKSDPYCVCFVEGRPSTKFATRVIDNNESPVWNHTDFIWDYQQGEVLMFRLYDKDWLSRDDTLGWAKLDLSQEVLPQFDGELSVKDAGPGINATLTVRVVWGTRQERETLLKQREARELLAGLARRAADRPIVCSVCQDPSRCEHEPSVEHRKMMEEMQEALGRAGAWKLEQSELKEVAATMVRWRDTFSKREALKKENDALRHLLSDAGAEVASGTCTRDRLLHALNAGSAAALYSEVAAVVEKVRARLAIVLRSSMEDLETTVALAKVAGLSGEDLAQAEAALAQERRRAEARRLIAEASRECCREKLEDAIRFAKVVGLRDIEWKEALELLNRGEAALKRERIKNTLDAACGDYKHLPETFAPESPEDAQKRAEVIQRLEKAIRDAKAAETAWESIERGERLLLQEQQRQALEALALASGKYEELYAKSEKALKRMQKDGAEPDEELKKAMLEARDRLKEAIAVARRLKVDEDAFGLRAAETMRKRLHNMLEDLKGAIRVICRVRPLSAKEKVDGEAAIARRFDLCTVEITQELDMMRPGVVAAFAAYERGERLEAPKPETAQYSFDAVFAPGAQDEIFQDCAELVQSALDGYNVTLFAFGQTGSGKTHTMFGDADCLGIAPRTVDQLFSIMEQTKDDYDYEVSVTVLELYCDVMVDLLEEKKRLHTWDNGYPTSGDKSKEPTIKHERDGTVTVTNLTSRPCTCAKDLHAAISVGAANREVSKTYKNDRSSRSHLICSIRVIVTDRRARGRPVSGKIILCDLAGSERTKHFPPGMCKEKQLREANEINKSLASLADVIKALVVHGEHVPYRNSKLTQILQDSLGGTAKALMFVNCSPASGSRGETLSSLNWATAAKGITNQFNAAHLQQVQGESGRVMPKGSPKGSPRPGSPSPRGVVDPSAAAAAPVEARRRG